MISDDWRIQSSAEATRFSLGLAWISVDWRFRVIIIVSDSGRVIYDTMSVDLRGLANIALAREISPRRQGRTKAERGNKEVSTTDSYICFWFIFFTTPTRFAEVGRGWKKKLWKDIDHLSVTYGTGMADETNAEKRKAESSGRAQSGEALPKILTTDGHGWTRIKKRAIHHGDTENTEKKLKS
jgi:hypothetical protein